MNAICTSWNSEKSLLHTELRGNITESDIVIWRNGLYRKLDSIPSNSRFRLLFNLHGYEPKNIGAHKAMRNVIPEVLVAFELHLTKRFFRYCGMRIN